MSAPPDPATQRAPIAGGGARAGDLLAEVIDALTEGLAIFDEMAALVACNAGFRQMNAAIADLLSPGVSWDILLREWVARGCLPAPTRDRLSWMEARLADGDRTLPPIELESGDLVFEFAMRPTATGGFVLMQTDVTDRRLFEESERAADILLRKVLEACPANIVMSRVGDGEIIYRTPAATELLGTADQANAHFASREERADFITALLPNGRVDDMPATGLRANGSRFPSLVSARLIDYRGEDVMVSTTIDVSKEMELRRKLAEQREQIFQAEKMSALGELLAGVAHELNNPLSVVVGHALMLRDENIDPDTLRRVEKISDAAERCARIVKSFLAMARQQPTRLVPVDVAETVELAIDSLKNGAEGLNAEIALDVPADLPPMRGDALQIAQVLINLVTNADQAIRDSGEGDTIRISARHDAKEGMIEMTVDDNGPGIPEAIRGRIFDPLFTTKPVGSGTGIGLALCHRIVTGHAGQISISPAGNVGATILVRIPVATGTDSPGAADGPAEAAAPLGRILVVDDEPDVAELIGEILKKEGFQVEIAASAEAALVQVAARDYALILTDMNMPGIGGRGFYERLLRENPGLARRVGFVTGDTMSPQVRGFLDSAALPYLEKPIAPAELRRLVKSILGTGGKGGQP